MYRIADCTNPRKKKVVHFNRLKRAPVVGKVLEPASVKDMGEGAILLVDPVPGNRNGNDLLEDSLEEEIVWMPLQTKPQKFQTMFQDNRRLFLQLVNQLFQQLIMKCLGHLRRFPLHAPVWRSSRQTRPPMRYGDPISLPDDVDIL